MINFIFISKYLYIKVIIVYCLCFKLSPNHLSNHHLTIALFYQYFKLYIYFYLSKGTPDPPSAFPRAFLIIVIGSIGA